MYKFFLKRLLDIICALILLPFVLIVLIIIAPLIFLDDRGPMFYNASRLGKKGKVFKMYKLRSMKVNAPDIRNEDGSTYNSENDSRVTKLGRFIRKTSIDELPQIFNILRGEMSFVGPRPDLIESIDVYDKNEIRRLDVLPGITGFSQAYVRNSVAWRERIKNDLYYVDHISLILDVKIILQTVKIVIKKDNVYAR
ncbi:lipopolysaccharide/colanic/teichoic acid biosynthesis glycosyltransferase [Psychrobacillus insolitus]|uniref:Lipopolysaccharide/colanic/teichoic acid biosynthesis glycosyltransferase n=1 Tax=Psychrobacillus insolitus TaxID=1461 RepID=A0A2W7MJ86_9BACI|nr:sugar transferase [Psychrobacillus insolitus]PZX05939.1 lipopolysaccharide/colanic/teichoic acid biosynthesis glycosyltransferase [Psychrobacillus insolitus]